MIWVIYMKIKFKSVKSNIKLISNIKDVFVSDTKVILTISKSTTYSNQ